MGQYQRKKPFSGKQKKTQLQEKRARQREAVQVDETAPRVTRSAVARIRAAATGDGEGVRYQLPFLRFCNETDAEVVAAHARAEEPLHPAPAVAGVEELRPFWGVDKMVKLMHEPVWDQSLPVEANLDVGRALYTEWLEQMGTLADDDETIELTHFNQFETNLSVWRELWRVIRRSDVVSVVVDARFPAAHLPACIVDLLADYQKPWMVIINKSDLVEPSVILEWTNAILTVFPACGGVVPASASDDRAQLCRRIADCAHKACPNHRGELAIGLLGQPSVGKSTLLNTIVGRRLARTSRTPGCSKHYQTGYMPLPPPEDRSVLIVDCPGCIFPVRGAPRPLYVLLGVVPLGQTREFAGAIRSLLELGPNMLSRLPMPKGAWARAGYGTRGHDRVPEASELSPEDVLVLIAEAWSYFKRNGGPDTHRAGIRLLKDVVDGRIPYSVHPGEVGELGREWREYRIGVKCVEMINDEYSVSECELEEAGLAPPPPAPAPAPVLAPAAAAAAAEYEYEYEGDSMDDFFD